MAYQCTSMSFQNICNIKDIDSNIVICSNNISPTLTSFEPKQQISQSFTNVSELETSQEAMSVDTSYEENNQNPDELSQPLFGNLILFIKFLFLNLRDPIKFIYIF